MDTVLGDRVLFFVGPPSVKRFMETEESSSLWPFFWPILVFGRIWGVDSYFIPWVHTQTHLTNLCA